MKLHLLAISLCAAAAALGLGVAAQAASPPEPQAQAVGECTSYGLTPGSAEFKNCVSSMADADAAAAGDYSHAPQNADAAAIRQKVNGDMARQRKQMDDEMRAAQNNPKCVTTHNGSNTSTVCPES